MVTLPAAVLALLLAAFGIGTRSLWNDEYATWYASTLSWSDLLRLLDNVDAVVAPYYLFMHGWIVVFGDSEAAMRMPSAVAMALSAALIGLIGRRLFDSGVGVVAGVMFAGLPVVSRYGQEARPYAFAVAAVALATLLLLRAMEAPTWRRWWLYGACLAAAVLMHIVTLTVLVPHAVLVWREMRTRDDFRLLRWTAPVVLAGTVALPMVAKGRKQTGAISWIRADLNAVLKMPEKMFGSVPVALTVMFAATVAVALLWRARPKETALLVVWAVFPPLFCYVTFPLLHLFLHRYLLFTVPAWVLLAAAAGFGVARLAGDRRSSVALSSSALLIVAGMLLVSQPGHQAARRDPVQGEPDFRAAARVVATHMQPGDAIAFGGTERNGRRAFAFAYELRGTTPPRDVFVAKTSQENGTFGAVECAKPAACLGVTRRIWLVTATAPGADPYSGMNSATKNLLAAEFTGVEVGRAERVRVLLLERRSDS